MAWVTEIMSLFCNRVTEMSLSNGAWNENSKLKPVVCWWRSDTDSGGEGGNPVGVLQLGIIN